MIILLNAGVISTSAKFLYWFIKRCISLCRQQKVFQDDPESYNGARRDHFRWAQSINDLDLRINVRNTFQYFINWSKIVEKYLNCICYKNSNPFLVHF